MRRIDWGIIVAIVGGVVLYVGAVLLVAVTMDGCVTITPIPQHTCECCK